MLAPQTQVSLARMYIPFETYYIKLKQLFSKELAPLCLRLGLWGLYN